MCVMISNQKSSNTVLFELSHPENKTYTPGDHYLFLVHVPLGDVEQRYNEIGSKRDGVLMASLLNEQRQGTFCGEGGFLLASPRTGSVKGMSRVDTGGEIADNHMDSLSDLLAPATNAEYNQIDIDFDGSKVVGVMLKKTPGGETLGMRQKNEQLRELANRHQLPIAFVEVTASAMPNSVSSTTREFARGSTLATYTIPYGSHSFLKVDVAHGDFYHSPGVGIISRSMVIDAYGQTSQELTEAQRQRIRQELSLLQAREIITEQEMKAVDDGFIYREV